MKGIQFRPDMAQAIYEGRKTMTRRPLKPQPNEVIGITPTYGCLKEIKPKYKAGEVLYVKEEYSDYVPGCPLPVGVSYRANHITESDGPTAIKWKPPMFMPEKYARSFIRILSVRLDRVQDIGIKDERKEGINPWGKYSFQDVWQEIYADKPDLQWSVNPYVWAYEFERVTP